MDRNFHVYNEPLQSNCRQIVVPPVPNRNVCATQVLPMGVGRSVPLRSDIKATELPLQICWYHSKGNWLRYNFAADSFCIMKLCSRLLVLYCRNCPKDDKFRYLIPILRTLGAVQTLVDGSLESPCRLLINWTSFPISYCWGATRQNVSRLAAIRRE